MTDHRSSSLPLADLKEALAGFTRDQLEDRKNVIFRRLKQIGIDDPKASKKKDSKQSGSHKKSSIKSSKRASRQSPATPPPSSVADSTTATTTAPGSKLDENAPNDETTMMVIDYEPKTTDIHWDFVLKEMSWLSADFQGERKRQHTLGKKISSSVKQFFKTKETRRIRELAEAELKRRRFAGKIGREVKGWWTKIERVIAYKQKLDADKERRSAMNKQLVALVKQTERYGHTLTTKSDFSDDEDDNDDDHDDESNTIGRNLRRRRRRQQNRSGRKTIEEVLAEADAKASRRNVRHLDYARFVIDDGDKELYGESTEESGSDGSYVLDNNADEEDDETTLREAEKEEIEARRKRMLNASTGNETNADDPSYVADETELQQLQEEAHMDISDVLERLQEDGNEAVPIDDTASNDEPPRAKVVQFIEPDTTKENVKNTNRRRASAVTSVPLDTGHEADDDGDASDVEDFEDQKMSVAGDSDDDSGEFIGDTEAVDDETTIAAEERLGREMSAQDEIDMLQRESTMPIEELMKLYASRSGSTMEAEDNSQDNAKVELEASINSSVSQHSTIGDVEETADGEEEFQPTLEVDDETTIEAEERLGREMPVEQEISLLESESEIPIERLRAMYAEMASAAPPESQPVADAPAANSSDCSLNPSRTYFSNGVDDSAAGDEFLPDSQLVVDDETTIEAEEKLGREMSVEDELAMLQRESEIPVEELRKMYAVNDDDTDVGQSMEGEDNDDNDDGSEEFIGDEHLVDDETTIAVEEKMGREMSVEAELSMLKEESEIPVEELRRRLQAFEPDLSSSEQSSTKRSSSDDGREGSKRRRIGETSVSASEDEGLKAIKALQAAEAQARKTQVTRPYLLANWVKLREYQQIGLNWLVSVQRRRLNAILADEMGLGKTLQSIALLGYLASYNGIWGPHLIVVPTSTIINWETEFKRFCPAFKVLCYYGSAKRRKELRSGWTKVNWYHVVITSYQLVVQDSFAFKRKKWYYMILDEAHNIKNFQSQRWQTLINFNTQRRLLLTGTPLQNSLLELWSLLHFLMPHVFRSRKEFSYWFSNPVNSIIEGNSKRSNDLIGRLHGIIRPFVLRRLKKDVAKQMPGKFEHIVKCPMSRRQMFLYEEFMARSSTRQALKKGGNFMGMMNVLMNLRKVCNHPDLFEPRSVVTPLFLDNIDYRVPRCAAVVVDPLVPINTGELSLSIMLPCWCRSSSDPMSMNVVNDDHILSDSLSALSIPTVSFTKRFLGTTVKEPSPESDMDEGLRSLLLLNIERETAQRQETKHLQSIENARRCSVIPFPYTGHVEGAVSLYEGGLSLLEPDTVINGNVMSTPADLLAMRRTQKERAEDLTDLIQKFVFCVPRAGSSRPQLDSGGVNRQSECFHRDCNQVLLRPCEELLTPYRATQARLSSFFPDKRLVQYDAGKLQTLVGLLRKLKAGRHRALIFTQMSKMLDVLEAFLNMNGHTYLRLDGGTSVDRRQRLMDRFNADEKIFCFILSTRSGGQGVNLVGADTVIFYDSDWNPAMDAQAQDRAHRIGQTRDVHIYRLITEHSIEENIWTKAKQKRNLDLIVMQEGKFDAGGSSKEQNTGDIYTKGGLREILGDTSQAYDDGGGGKREDDEKVPTKEEMQRTMAALEDDDDAAALIGAQKEADEDLKEFDESVEYKNDTVDGDTKDTSNDNSGKNKNASDSVPVTADEQSDVEKEKKGKHDDEMVKEFEKWQKSVGMDAGAIESSLSPTEKYGLQFRDEIDPFWSIFAIMEEKRKAEAMEEEEDEIDIDEVERIKAEEERTAIADGDILGTRPIPEDLPRQRRIYLREKARLHASKKVRMLTGENWVTRVDAGRGETFWYNEDTGEARWDKPVKILEMESLFEAVKRGWEAIPQKILVHMMGYLIASPERTSCASVCKRWKVASTDISFVRHVYPVEVSGMFKDKQMHPNHYRSIAEAMAVCQPGDTIELGDGHYWVEAPGLDIKVPIKLIGDENDPSHVVIELSGSVEWSGKGGLIEGITLRRPRLVGTSEAISSELIRITGRVDIIHSEFCNLGNKASCVSLKGPGPVGTWKDVAVNGSGGSCGVLLSGSGEVVMDLCSLSKNAGSGLLCTEGSKFKINKSKVEHNGGSGIRLTGKSKGELTKSVFTDNAGGLVVKESGSSCTPCTGNFLRITAKSQSTKTMPGFKLSHDDDAA